MGRMIESVALSRGHEITCRIDCDNTADFDSEAFRSSDVAIEFSIPAAAEGNVRRALAAGVPVVCGTTGWYDALPLLRRECDEGRGSLIAASNFSIGVNIFMAINRRLAEIMARFPQYTPSMEEVHHIHKLDHPSGTALTLARGIMEADPAVTAWAEPAEEATLPEGTLPIRAIRRGEVPGIHTVEWDSTVDTITISHSAKSREGFALGAVLAAEWLPSHPGYHTIGEVLGL